MRSDRRLGGRGALAAAILAIFLAFVGWQCIRTAMIIGAASRAAPPARMGLAAPSVVLARATDALVAQRGILTPAMLAEVRGAAARAPLDARAFLVLGHQQLLDGMPARAVTTLERGRQLDPRQRLIHLLLLDRYLRTGRYADAATSFSLLARLVGNTQGPIATALAQMSQAPQTREAVRRTFEMDPALERSVLIALARSDTAPDVIFALASRRARMEAGSQDNWGAALVWRLAERRRYAEARTVWQRVYGIADDDTATVYDPSFNGLPGSPPFNWTLASGSLGVADLHGGALTVDFYGRESGELGSQMLLLHPGRYRFAFTAEGARVTQGSALFWTLRCAGDGGRELGRFPVVGQGAAKRVQAGLSVPADCPVQRLMLFGEAGEFPAPVAISIRDLDLRAQ